MAPSQLKQLKAALREHGVTGPQKSKKVRKANSKDGQRRLQRNAALEGIRERFNPFEVKGPARKEKFEVSSNKPKKVSIERPGITRGLGEERRRETLLKEMQSRNKVGGMQDRRFGENDPTMTPEERAAERFARQAMQMSKKNSVFNLEDDSEEEMVLTHGGRSLDLDDSQRDDYREDHLDGVDPDDLDDRPTKRIRFEYDGADVEEGDDVLHDPQTKKTKKEVMQEVIAKSKMYKAERQAAKADDDDLRAELDKGMGDFYAALRGQKKTAVQLPSPPHTDSEPTMDPGRAAMLAGKSREDAEKEYEANLRQLKLDARSKPSVRTKTEEEKAAEQAAKLEELERSRQRRMKGEPESSDEEDQADVEVEDEDQDEQDDAKAFGLQQPQFPPRPQLDVEDEDDFVLDDIIASDPEANSEASDDEDENEDIEPEDDGDDDFINGLVLPNGIEVKSKPESTVGTTTSLAYTFPCPQTHDELLEITKTTKLDDLPTIVQRIRALYHKGLAQDNQEKLGNFAKVLIQHISYLTDGNAEHLSFAIVESLLRHLHSMAKSQPDEIGQTFRAHLREIAEQRPLALTAGDLLLLTGISTIFPTSDHFHSVSTPAMLTIARYLGQSTIQTSSDLAIGVYSCTLALQYQKVAKRFVPEVVTYLVNAVAILAPAPLPQKNQSNSQLNIGIRLPAEPLRITQKSPKKTPKLSFDALRQVNAGRLDQNSILKAAISLIDQASDLWRSKSAFPEFASSLKQAVQHLLSPSCKILAEDILQLAQQTSDKISTLIHDSISNRKPLLLHNHKPLAIKSSIPQFIENFNPDKHYDPDRDRAELSKLRAEHKKERKGAMRELRKDANFIAREQLREKKAKDEAYEKKFTRLIAEIQGEEGREAKEYEREKKRRKSRM